MVELRAPGNRGRRYCWQACTSAQMTIFVSVLCFITKVDCVVLLLRKINHNLPIEYFPTSIHGQPLYCLTI